MPAATFPNGTWERLVDVDTNLTGEHLVHNPALVRDAYGNVNPTSAGVEVIYSGGSNDPDTWDLRHVTWKAPTGRRPLNRYYNAATGSHLISTGFIPAGYAFEGILGYLSWSPAPGSVPLYGCIAGANDRFVSMDSACEGQNSLGVNGYLWRAAPAGIASVAVYRCYTGTDHFVSSSAACEGQQTEALLGYLAKSA